MQNIDSKKLFLIACILKLISLVIAFALKDILVFGFLIPTLVMLSYIFIGYFNRDKVVSDEKFADSCYYLGFIFTIATILAILMDLESINHDLTTIASRFGMAMISTLLGIIARVFIIGFKQDSRAALDKVERTLLQTANNLVDQMEQASQRFGQFTQQLQNDTEHALNTIASTFEQLANNQSKQLEAATQNLSQFSDKIQENVNKTFNQINPQFDKLDKSFTSLEQNLDKFNQALAKHQEQYNQMDFAKVLDLNKSAIEQLTHKLDEFNNNNTDLVQSLQDSSKNISDSLGNIERLQTNIDKLNQVLAEQTQELVRNLDPRSLSLLGEKLSQLTQQFEENTKATKEAQQNPKAEEVLTYLHQISNSLADIPKSDNKEEIVAIKSSLEDLLRLFTQLGNIEQNYTNGGTFREEKRSFWQRLFNKTNNKE